MSNLEIIGAAGLIITILGIVVTVTKQYTKLQTDSKLERLKNEKDILESSCLDLKRRNLDIEARYNELIDELAIASKYGNAALIKKQEIQNELSHIIKYMKGSAGSITIPLNNEKLSEGIIFLAIQPFSKESEALKSKVIPIKSFAGRCFTSGVPFVTNSKSDPTHYVEADKISGYQTEDTINFPLRHQGKMIGVLQLLNKLDHDGFNLDDIPRIQHFAEQLTDKVADFINTPNYMKILGFDFDKEVTDAVVMFCDLTHSSVLFQEMNPQFIIIHLNEYMERLCSVAFKYGGSVDNYMGDGIIFKFFIHHSSQDVPLNAIKAALEMQITFDKLKKEWISGHSLVKTIHNRIGIAYGQVNKATVGHPLYQRLTILGPAVNVAANLCEISARDRNVILINESLYNKYKGMLNVTQIPKDKLSKIAESAYELSSLKE